MMRLIWAASLVLLVGCGDATSDQAVVWRLTSEPAESTIQVGAEFGGSSCARFKEWRVDESRTEVKVQAIVTFSGAGDCTADLVFLPRTIRLAEPLGDRRLAGCAPEDSAAACDEIAPDPALGDAGAREES